jgi:sensor histidine kinase regulating citrate/malate metabolism
MEYELLLNRQLTIEAATTDQLIRDRERQYETSRDTIDAINIKMHDIRHQIRHLEDGSEGTTVLSSEMLREIAKGVNVYDSAVKTGNDALNTILTEKSLLCDSLGIEFTCSADGSKLSFLSPAELYSLFGNMIDNAIEATRGLENPEKKVITLGVRFNAGLITIHEENYFAGEVQFAEHVPQSTKNDPLNHGYGYRSMKMIVEGHGGVIDCGTSGDVFSLDIVIPVDE